MKTLHQRVATLSISLASITSTYAQAPKILVHSLSDPLTNALAYAGHGAAVAVSGNFAVIGAPSSATTANLPGRVKVYDMATGGLLHTLMAPNPATQDSFGGSVAISGTRIAIAAAGDDTGATDAGSVYVFDLAGTTPTAPLITLTNPSPAHKDYFGSSVGIEGQRVVVGTALEDAGAEDAGTAYVFDLASAAPTVPVITLSNPSPEFKDFFGNALAISGSRVVVAAYLDKEFGGASYVYNLNGATPSLPSIVLTNPSPLSAGYFGTSVAISGTTVVVGVGGNGGATDAGNAYVYDLTSVTPALPAITLTNPTPVSAEQFGVAVAISGTRVVVGAILDSTGSYRAGSAYVYELTNSIPDVPVATLRHPAPAFLDIFGEAVAIAGPWIVIGAPWDDVGVAGIDSGSAYVFSHGPVLRMTPARPGFTTVSWAPTNLPRLVLQYTDSLTPTNWINAPSGLTNPVVIAATNASRFHRLMQQ